eukprot:gene9856-2047_t
MPTHKLIVVGDGGVGKSAITLQFMYEEFVEDYEPTKADSYRKKITLDGTECQVDILDTAGQLSPFIISPYCSRLTHDSYLSQGFLCVFSLVDTRTFEDMEEFREQIYRVHETEKMPIVLVGNKSDMTAERQVTAQQAKQLAQSWGVEYIETSAKLRTNIDEAFETLARAIRDSKTQGHSTNRKHQQGKRKKKCTLL